MPRLTAYESPFQVTLKGVAAGLVGTLVMTSALQAAAMIIGRVKAATVEDEDDLSHVADLEALDVSPQMPATEQVAERLASQVFRRELSDETRQRIGVGIHWAYGAFWGALSAQLQLTLRPPAVPYGTALGLAIWAVGPARLVPALGLYERPASSGVIRRLIAIGLHVLYGLSTAWTLERLSAPR
jgi:hypothetical protein